MTEPNDRAFDATAVTLAQVMLPEDANSQGNIHGGNLMKLADSAGGVATVRHCRGPVVTVVMDSMTFENPVYVGDLVEVRARVTWTGRTSVETMVTIDAETVNTGHRRRVSQAYFVYVAIDDHGKPRSVPALAPVTEEDRYHWLEAEERRSRRLAQGARSAPA